MSSARPGRTSNISSASCKLQNLSASAETDTHPSSKQSSRGTAERKAENETHVISI